MAKGGKFEPGLVKDTTMACSFSNTSQAAIPVKDLYVPTIAVKAADIQNFQAMLQLEKRSKRQADSLSGDGFTMVTMPNFPAALREGAEDEYF